MKELPTLPAMPACPAAASIAGVDYHSQGAICRIMQRDHEEDAGLGMTAAASGFIQHEATAGVLLTLKSDPDTVIHFCHGDAMPVADDREIPGGRAHYTYCPVWQAECERIEDGRDELLIDAEPERVAAGISVSSQVDPFAAARDLDELAPPKAA